MNRLKSYVKKFLFKNNIRVTRIVQSKEVTRFNQIYQKYAHFTMIGKAAFVKNLELVHHYVKGLPGDIVECGVWRGGMIAGMADYLKGERTYFLFDSFEGLPPVKEIDGANAKAWQQDTHGPLYYNNCTAPIEAAEEAMKMTGCSFEIYKGWFENTISNFSSSDKIALLRLDADWYDSTMICLKHLYPKLVYDGLIIIDDYYAWDGCSRAVHDYLSGIKSVSRIKMYDNICFIQKKDKENFSV